MLKIQNLTKKYDDKKAVDGLSLHIRAGELYGFIGHNGAGKTTTLKACCGILGFEEGEIFVDGVSVKENPLACKKKIAYIPDDPKLYAFMKGIQYLHFVGDIFEVPSDIRQARIRKYADAFELTEALAQPIASYSHGMKQKLCLIASLMHNPNVWILDEPTVGLDIMAQEELKKMMREYANHGKTVFVTSHNIELIAKICDKVAIINDGVVATVFDLNRDPNKRLQLPKLFIDTYGD